MSPTAGVLRHQRSNSLGDRSEGEAAMAAARARGQASAMPRVVPCCLLVGMQGLDCAARVKVQCFLPIVAVSGDPQL